MARRVAHIRFLKLQVEIPRSRPQSALCAITPAAPTPIKPREGRKKALSGEIKNFTGISDPYEEPLKPEIVVNTSVESPEESARKIVAKLEELGWVRSVEDQGVYSQDEEQAVEKRLRALGYL